jgi:putative acetyltransferase
VSASCARPARAGRSCVHQRRHRAKPSEHTARLETWPDNAPAIALYTSFGFEIEGERRRHYRRRDGTLRSSLLMARLLEPELDQSRPSGGT